jgi:hypothetical protein
MGTKALRVAAPLSCFRYLKARFANRSCCRPSTLTAKRRARRMRDHVSEWRDAQNDTRGSSSETEVSELTISPAVHRLAQR